MNKLNSQNFRFLAALLLFFSVLVAFTTEKANAQLKEPPVREIEEPISPYGQGYRNRIGASFVLNNFGFGITGIYARAIAPFTEITLTAGITGLRDVSAQEFIFFRTGRKIVPNRFKRALGFPLMIGIERRLFPYAIDDNFRFFISADFGPAFAFTYPYFEDVNNNGYRDSFLLRTRFGPRLDFVQNINNFFEGWGEGDWHAGFSGDLSIGVDIGSDFDSQATLEIGYFFYYFPNELQLMEPFKKERYIEFRPNRGEPCNLNQSSVICLTDGQQPFFDAQSYFGTPQIKFTYSWWL